MQKLAKTTLGLLAIIALLSSVLAYSLWLYTVSNTMSISTHKQIQVEKPLTTKIASYAWGDFNKSVPTKTETFYLRSYNNVPINITWNTENLDVAFTFVLSVTTFEFTSYNQTISFNGTLTLVDFSHEPDSFGFNLKFGE